MGTSLGSGCLSSNESSAGSVAKAKAAKVSMMRLTQRSCTAFITLFSSPLITDEVKVMIMAVMLTANWN
jgi:hypothetical protein